MYMCDPPRIYLSLLEYTPFSTTICDPPRIYPSLSEYTPLFNKCIYVRPSQNIPLPTRIHPPFQQLNATLPESTPPPSQNIPLFSTTRPILLCDTPRIYPSQNIPPPIFVISVFESQNLPSLPEYTPFSTNLYVRPSQNLRGAPSQNILPFSTNLYVRLSQNLPLPSRIYPPFKKMYICDPPQNLPLHPRTYPPPPFSPTICDPLRIYPSQNIPPFSTNVYVRPSQNLPPLRIYPFSTTMCDPPRIYPSLLEYTPPFSTTIILCDPSRIDPSLPE